MNEELKETLRSVLQEELKPIHQQLTRVDERFDEVDSRFTKIDERFDEVDNRFTKIDERFDEVDTRLRRVETDVKGLKDNLISGLGPYFERVISHIDDVKEITQNQQLVIDTLSARSVKHESEIEELKRIVKNC